VPLQLHSSHLLLYAIADACRQQLITADQARLHSQELWQAATGSSVVGRRPHPPLEKNIEAVEFCFLPPSSSSTLGPCPRSTAEFTQEKQKRLCVDLRHACSFRRCRLLPRAPSRAVNVSSSPTTTIIISSIIIIIVTIAITHLAYLTLRSTFVCSEVVPPLRTTPTLLGFLQEFLSLLQYHGIPAAVPPWVERSKTDDIAGSRPCHRSIVSQSQQSLAFVCPDILRRTSTRSCTTAPRSLFPPHNARARTSPHAASLPIIQWPKLRFDSVTDHTVVQHTHRSNASQSGRCIDIFCISIHCSTSCISPPNARCCSAAVMLSVSYSAPYLFSSTYNHIMDGSQTINPAALNTPGSCHIYSTNKQPFVASVTSSHRVLSSSASRPACVLLCLTRLSRSDTPQHSVARC